MLKKSTLLSVSIFVLLFIGLSDYGYGCHKEGSNDKKGCDDSVPQAIPVVVYFDDANGDSIQSDGVSNDKEYPDGSYINEESVSAIIAIEGHPPGQFVMHTLSGGGRKLFIDFGPAVPCFNGGPKDCVTDAVGDIVKCPFPIGLRTPNDDSCSALVPEQAGLGERTAFDLNGNGEENIEYILDMNPTPPPCEGEGCPSCPGPDCAGPVKMVRPHQEWDIQFGLPRPKGKHLTRWTITFSDQDGNCSGQNIPTGRSFPDFLSIRALNVVNGVGGVFGADTWNIGTFDEDGWNVPKLACLIKLKGDEFVGFFSMSFMYTIEIK